VDVASGVKKGLMDQKSMRGLVEINGWMGMDGSQNTIGHRGKIVY
jgi:hypothetical protein